MTTATRSVVIEKEMPHPPEKVWAALTDPAQLREWAPFDADHSLGTVGPVKLSLVGGPAPQVNETQVTRAEAPELYNLLENLCISRGLQMPSLRIVESDALNAFATGLNQKQYSISVTRGLVNALDRRELDHENLLGRARPVLAPVLAQAGKRAD